MWTGSRATRKRSISFRAASWRMCICRIRAKAGSQISIATTLRRLDKQGAVIDERFNAGGQVADYFIEVLGRHIESYWAPRYGKIEHTPNAGIYGPKVMIANEFSGSGGDALPWLFKQAKLGPLVGKRTWGGLVGIGPIPVLMDGGHVTSPSVAFFSPKGEWDVENHGVDPDYVVEQDPKAVSEGHDPQLEKAVSLALEELSEDSAARSAEAGLSELPQRPVSSEQWVKMSMDGAPMSVISEQDQVQSETSTGRDCECTRISHLRISRRHGLRIFCAGWDSAKRARSCVRGCLRRLLAMGCIRMG